MSFKVNWLLVSNIIFTTSVEHPSDIDKFDITEFKSYYEIFTKYYSHTFNEEENEEYYKSFVQNIHLIIDFNTKYKAEFRINEFSHLNLEKFSQLYTGFNSSMMDNIGVKDFSLNDAHITNNSYLDHNLLWISSYPKHQGPCKCSYVTSAIANIEAQIERSFSVYKELSVLQGFACEPLGTCQDGGLPHLVMEALKQSDGLLKWEYHPYDKPNLTAEKICPKVSKSHAKFVVSAVHRLRVTDEKELTSAVYVYGPLVTAIYVSDSVKNYNAGVLDPLDCENQSPNHAVLLVGYAKEENSEPYWLLKNSWGDEWGEFGYMKLVRGKKACGIGSYLATVDVDRLNKTYNVTAMPPVLIPSDWLAASTTPHEPISIPNLVVEKISSEVEPDDFLPGLEHNDIVKHNDSDNHNEKGNHNDTGNHNVTENLNETGNHNVTKNLNETSNHNKTIKEPVIHNNGNSTVTKKRIYNTIRDRLASMAIYFE